MLKCQYTNYKKINIMTIGIYKITNMVNNKYYIGSSNNIEKRIQEHKCGLSQNKHHNKHLQAAYNKYGAINFTFEIIDFIKKDRINSLYDLEQFYLDAVPNWSKVYNISNNTTCPTLNIKYENSKYYSYDKHKNIFVVCYRIDGIQHRFGTFDIEEDAIKQVAYIKSLSKKDLLDYLNSVQNTRFKISTSNKQRNKEAYKKGYVFDKQRSRYRVRIWQDNKIVTYGQYKTEEEAINRVKEVKASMNL